jgi:hypothetical protein
VPRKNDNNLTERQYRTLRKLIFLWFAVIVRRRYHILQNIVLILSLSLNLFFILKKDSPVVNIIERHIDMEAAFDLSKYPSISNPDQTLKRRYERVYSVYIENKETPDSSHYTKNGNEVHNEWIAHCKTQLKKIILIKSRIRTIQKLLQNSYPDKEDEIFDIVQNKRYDETLADMSNYYAKFLSSGEYDYIVKTFD